MSSLAGRSVASPESGDGRGTAAKVERDIGQSRSTRPAAASIRRDQDRGMTRTPLLRIAVLSTVFAAGTAFAQEEAGELEATIRLMSEAEAELPEAVTREIVLPANVTVDDVAVEASAKGLGKADDARQGGRERGQGVAAEARENASADARDNASDMAEAARENAENRSRANENRPERPERPETPNPNNGQ